MPKKIEQWKCELCGEEFDTKEECLKHETREGKSLDANDMLRAGYTLKEINDKLHIWKECPSHLEQATKDHCFTIPHLQSCRKPAYKICRLIYTGGVFGTTVLSLWGCGSWDGYYGCDLAIDSRDLRDIHPPEDLFVHKRY